jgi:3'-phosphoadenosine 5'-phosphosulfate (PAPS) 3'-phosphatase
MMSLSLVQTIGLQLAVREPPLGTGSRVFFTLDPLDGTKAFVRRQSRGVGIMVALLHDGRSYPPVNNHENYGYPPGSTKVHR